MYGESRSRAHKFPRSLLLRAKLGGPTRSSKEGCFVFFTLCITSMEEEGEEEGKERLCALPREEGHENFLLVSRHPEKCLGNTTTPLRERERRSLVPLSIGHSKLNSLFPCCFLQYLFIWTVAVKLVRINCGFATNAFFFFFLCGSNYMTFPFFFIRLDFDRCLGLGMHF